MDEFCELVGNTPFFPKQKEVFKEAGLLRAYDFIKFNRDVQEIILMWGKGSGKDFVASIIIAYLAYVINCLNSDPTEYYNLRRGDTISIINVAPNAHLAKAVFFDGYLKKHIQHPLFTKSKFIDVEIPEKGHEITFYRRDSKTNNRYPFLVLRSLHSSSSGLDGFNTLAFVLDEADDFMNSDKTKSVAEEIHTILTTSATTRFGSRWLGFIISYPRLVDGFMMKLVERAKSAPKRFFYDVSPTHVVNPKFDINNETVQEEFKNNPAEASAKYMVTPMQTEDAFFEFTEKIDEAVDLYRNAVCEIITEPLVQEVQGVGYVSYVSPKIVSEVTRTPGREYFLGGDSGHVGDSFVISVCHIDKSVDAWEYLCPRCVKDAPDLLNAGRYVKVVKIPEDYSVQQDAHCGICLLSPEDWHSQTLCIGWYRRDEPEFQSYEVGNTKIKLPRVVEDLICEIRPIRKGSEGKNYPVHFTSVEKVCEDLINKLKIPKARLDAWATPQMIQNLRGSCTGCDIDSISMANSQQYKRARCIKTLLYNNCLSLLPNDKRDMEWKRLQRKGYSIQHPSTGSKDIYDAESISIFLALQSRVPNIELLLG